MNSPAGQARQRVVDVITANTGEGAQITGCRLGPQALLDAGLMPALAAAGCVATLSDAIYENASDVPRQAPLMTARNSAASAAAAPALPVKMSIVAATMPVLAQATRAAVARGHFPLVLGGDHSCAVGTWSGIAESWQASGRIGLIWIDAHLDSHTPETSETQAPHGMPLAALLGHGAPALTSLYGWRSKILPQHAVIVGARSYEAGEVALLTRLGVRVMTMTEVAARGFAACIDEAIGIVSHGTCGYGVSFDLDAIDPDEAPAVGSPALDGIDAREVRTAFRRFGGDPRLLGLEFVEFNPRLDDAAGQTAALCQSLLLAALAQGVAADAAADEAAAVAQAAELFAGR